MAARKTFDSFQTKEHTPEKISARVKKLRERNPAAVLLGTYGAKKRYAKTVGDEVPARKQDQDRPSKGKRKAPHAKGGKS